MNRVTTKISVHCAGGRYATNCKGVVKIWADLTPEYAEYASVGEIEIRSIPTTKAIFTIPDAAMETKGWVHRPYTGWICHTCATIEDDLTPKPMPEEEAVAQPCCSDAALGTGGHTTKCVNYVSPVKRRPRERK